MQREQGHLNREGYKEGQEKIQLRIRKERHFAALDLAENRRVIERSRQVVEIDDGAQHEHRSGHGVQEELDGGINASIMSPDPNQKVYRNQRHFPEHVEHEQVQRNEHADEAEFQKNQ